MANKNIFDVLLNNYRSFSSHRHGIIKDSSDLLRVSKQVVFALHRDNLEEAEKLLKDAEAKIEKIKENKDVAYHEGSFKAGIEEYIEAKYFWNYLHGENPDILENIPDDFYNEYLGGICDFTGELIRRAVLFASNGEYDEIEKIRVLIDSIVGDLLKFNLVGKIRSKYDDAKRNLKRIEGIIYDIHIRSINQK